MLMRSFGALAAVSAGGMASQAFAKTTNVHATVTVLPSSPGTKLTSQYAGFSYEKSKITTPTFVPSNANLINLFKRLGPGVLRLGGNEVDRCTWNGVTAGLRIIERSQVDALNDFLNATGWKVIYGINLAKNTLNNATAEAQYASQRLGSNLIGFEVGNEPDLYHSNGLRKAAYAYGDYLNEWRTMADAIKQMSPQAPFAGPAGSFDLSGYCQPFARDTCGHSQVLTHHYYRASAAAASSTVDMLISDDKKIASIIGPAATQAHADGMQFRVGECNSFYGGGTTNVSNTFASALWALDFMFICASLGADGVNFHGGGNAMVYTPIADNNGAVQDVRPLYYGMSLFSMAAQGSYVPTKISFQDPRTSVSAYGVARKDGGMNVVIVNKDKTSVADLTVALGVNAKAVEIIRMEAPALNSVSGQTISGAPIGLDGSWKAAKTESRGVVQGSTTVGVNPFSAVLLRTI